MKNFLKGLVVLFVLATQRDKIAELNKSFEKPPEPDWTEKQLDAISNIDEMHSRDYLDREVDDYFINPRFRTTQEILATKIKDLNRQYQHQIRMADSYLNLVRVTNNFNQWLHGGTLNVSNPVRTSDFSSREEAAEQLRIAGGKLMRIQELSNILDINFNDLAAPDRDKNLHQMFGLD